MNRVTLTALTTIRAGQAQTIWRIDSST